MERKPEVNWKTKRINGGENLLPCITIQVQLGQSQKLRRVMIKRLWRPRFWCSFFYENNPWWILYPPFIETLTVENGGRVFETFEGHRIIILQWLLPKGHTYHLTKCSIWIMTFVWLKRKFKVFIARTGRVLLSSPSPLKETLLHRTCWRGRAKNQTKRNTVIIKTLPIELFSLVSPG